MTYRMPTRRRFVLGLSAASLAAMDGQGWTRPAASGRVIDLSIGALPVNITGRPRFATAVNGTMPGPVLRFRQGEQVMIRVTNQLTETTSIHWHGFRLPASQDGVPGLTFPGIAPGETFTYRFPVVQSGTYWYHSHSGMQEQTGLSGVAILEPQSPEPYAYDREHVIALADWTDEDPMAVLANLKQDSDYYNYGQRTLGTFIHDARADGLGATLRDRLHWGAMRMSPTDIMDVTGATYTFLMNGLPPAANWRGLFRPGERLRLRLVNMAAMTTFDFRIPGLAMTVVAADGSDVEPVTVDEIRLGIAETYDVLVTPGNAEAYTVFAQAQDRSGFARGTLAAREGLSAPVPPMDPRPTRSMADMGMAMEGMAMNGTKPDAMKMGAMKMEGMSGMKMDGMDMPTKIPSSNASGAALADMEASPEVDNIAMTPKDRLAEPGDGLEGNGRRVLTYAQLKARTPDAMAPMPAREIEFHLTGNMQRWIWGFDGKTFAEAPPVRATLGETVRFVLINDTMMEHPIHLHGFLFALENGAGAAAPRKHTVNVKPGERIGIVFNADTPGHWAFHCHLLYHMASGMFRTVLVA